MINDYEGKQLVKIAREAVETYIRRAMVPVKDDRYQSVVEAAIGAATIDPRFSPLVESELSRIIFELSFLTPPQLIQVVHPTDYYDHIKIGRDGLILRWEKGSALLLPQVAKRFGWDVDEFLLNLCYKGGTTPDAWVLPESKLYKFQAQVYIESEPKGRVIRLQ